MNYRSIILTVLLIIWLVAATTVYFTFYPRKDKGSVKTIAQIAIFGALAAILYTVPIFNIKLPFFPSFLSLHFDEIPSFIAGFAYGPWAAIGTILVKTIIKLPMTSTMAVGEIGDFLFSTAFVLPAVLIYQKKRNLKGVGLGFLVSTSIHVVVAMAGNVYLLMPFYMQFMAGLSYDVLLKLCQMAMPGITDLGWSYATIAVLPFNILKDALVIIATFLVYRSIHTLIKPSKRA